MEILISPIIWIFVILAVAEAWKYLRKKNQIETKLGEDPKIEDEYWNSIR